MGARVRPADRFRRYPGIGEQPVQHPRPGAERAPGDPQARQVSGPADTARVLLEYQQALLAAPQLDDRGLAAAEQGPGKRAVAVTGMMPQVDGRRVGGAASDPGQAVEAAARPHGQEEERPGAAQRDVQAGVIAARQPQRRMPTEQRPGRGLAGSAMPCSSSARTARRSARNDPSVISPSLPKNP
jgi:hypothetical protein